LREGILAAGFFFEAGFFAATFFGATFLLAAFFAVGALAPLGLRAVVFLFELFCCFEATFFLAAGLRGLDREAALLARFAFGRALAGCFAPLAREPRDVLLLLVALRAIRDVFPCEVQGRAQSRREADQGHRAGRWTIR